MRAALSYAWYRARRTRRTERGYLLSVVVLVAALGGLSLGAVAGARATESSYSDYVKASHVPQLFVLDGVIDPAIGIDSAYNPALLHTLAHLPHVDHIASTVELNMGPLTGQGHPVTLPSLSAEASVGGLDYSEDPLAISAGRAPNPGDPHDIAVDAGVAKELGYHVGQQVRLGWATNAQATSGDTSPDFVVPADQRVTVKVVGISEGQATTMFQDQDAVNSQSSTMLLTPALTNRLLACCSNQMLSALTLKDGDRFIGPVEQEVRRALPPGLPFVYVESRSILATAGATLRPETIALGVFGGIAGAAALLICGQVVTRRLRLHAAELDVVRALGADPAMTFWDGLLATLVALIAGAGLAIVVAVALSPLAPLGPVRSYLGVGVRPDWTVLGLGAATLLVVLAGVAALASLRAQPGGTPARVARVSSSRVTTAAARAGLPPSAVTGVRFALEPGVGRNAVPVRSAILGAVLAVTVVVATVTFGSSLSTLVTHPALYGWDWNYDMDGGGGLGDIPGAAAATLLAHDHDVSSWSGVYFSTLQVDGLTVPVLGVRPGAPVQPPLLSGSDVRSPHDVVLGADTLRQLGKRLGDTVVVRAKGAAPARLTVVGTATLPPIGVAGSSHLEMGTGAVLPSTLIPASDRNLYDVTPGPNAILVRTTGGPGGSALASLQDIARKLDIASNGGSVLPVQRPAQILNYETLGQTPVLLGAALAAGAAVALALTLVTSVRRRRRDLAILKTLGFTRRRLATVVAIQALVAVLIGCAVGIPVGIALGRGLWNLFAAQINAVPLPTVPAGTVAVIGALALALAVLVATVPGRIAARTPTSQLLRAE